MLTKMKFIKGGMNEGIPTYGISDLPMWVYDRVVERYSLTLLEESIKFLGTDNIYGSPTNIDSSGAKAAIEDYLDRQGETFAFIAHYDERVLSKEVLGNTLENMGEVVFMIRPVKFEAMGANYYAHAGLIKQD